MGNYKTTTKIKTWEELEKLLEVWFIEEVQYTDSYKEFVSTNYGEDNEIRIRFDILEYMVPRPPIEYGLTINITQESNGGKGFELVSLEELEVILVLYKYLQEELRAKTRGEVEEELK